LQKIRQDDFTVVYLAGYFNYHAKRLKLLSTEQDDNIELKDVFEALADLQNKNVLLVMDAYVIETSINGLIPSVPDSNICRMMEKVIFQEKNFHIICSCQGNMLAEGRVMHPDWDFSLLNSAFQEVNKQGLILHKTDDGSLDFNLKEILKIGKEEYLPVIFGN